jgi:hypothetical protein
MVPVAFRHAPSAPKAPEGADEERLSQHREACRQSRLNSHAIAEMERLREAVPAGRHVVFCGDGSYTNKSVIKDLPQGCTYIGRIRKDAKLHYPPEIDPEQKVGGRPPRYGKVAPTPDQLRADESVPWTRVRAFAAGKSHDFRVKTLGPVLWRKSGADKILRVMVIAPLGYRPRKGSRVLYRQPAFLICTDPDMSVEEFLQYYLWRWGIEVNFRDEKTLLGAGKAQVRTAASNRHLPAVIVAAYSLLWVAALRLRGRDDLPPSVAPPKWRRKKHQPPVPLPSTGDLLRSLRYEIWAKSIRPGSLYHFAHPSPQDAKCPKPIPNLPGALWDAA